MLTLINLYLNRSAAAQAKRPDKRLHRTFLDLQFPRSDKT